MKQVPKISQWFLWAVIIIPLNRPSPQWHFPAYSRLKANKISFGVHGLKIEVNDSASPLFYELPKVLQVKRLQLAGYLFGLPQLKNSGAKKRDDDLPLRVGLVETKDGNPNWIEKIFLPNWVKELLELFPHQEIKRVKFLTINPIEPVGTTILHPKSDLLEETVVLQQTASGPFKIDYTFPAPAPTRALWIQCDGDDTHSKYSVRLEKMNLEVLD